MMLDKFLILILALVKNRALLLLYNYNFKPLIGTVLLTINSYTFLMIAGQIVLKVHFRTIWNYVNVIVV